ncbi:Hypp8525 [Branchiostoma lanceolatum]|uniref:Hypp8525 protein n=1 Tax=Branchiostoma lanceolatum TaxID=7740 RepID=A0A8J9Z987_BRALA|nr:Hypp8525 [Branchiostoma lanceolatum]
MQDTLEAHHARVCYIISSERSSKMAGLNMLVCIAALMLVGLSFAAEPSAGRTEPSAPPKEPETAETKGKHSRLYPDLGAEEPQTEPANWCREAVQTVGAVVGAGVTASLAKTMAIMGDKLGFGGPVAGMLSWFGRGPNVYATSAAGAAIGYITTVGGRVCEFYEQHQEFIDNIINAVKGQGQS